MTVLVGVDDVVEGFVSAQEAEGGGRLADGVIVVANMSSSAKVLRVEGAG